MVCTAVAGKSMYDDDHFKCCMGSLRAYCYYKGQPVFYKPGDRGSQVSYDKVANTYHVSTGATAIERAEVDSILMSMHQDYRVLTSSHPLYDWQAPQHYGSQTVYDEIGRAIEANTGDWDGGSCDLETFDSNGDPIDWTRMKRILDLFRGGPLVTRQVADEAVLVYLGQEMNVNGQRMVVRNGKIMLGDAEAPMATILSVMHTIEGASEEYRERVLQKKADEGVAATADVAEGMTGKSYSGPKGDAGGDFGEFGEVSEGGCSSGEDSPTASASPDVVFFEFYEESSEDEAAPAAVPTPAAEPVAVKSYEAGASAFASVSIGFLVLSLLVAF
jgi:hypothetical protein